MSRKFVDSERVIKETVGWCPLSREQCVVHLTYSSSVWGKAVILLNATQWTCITRRQPHAIILVEHPVSMQIPNPYCQYTSGTSISWACCIHIVCLQGIAQNKLNKSGENAENVLNEMSLRQKNYKFMLDNTVLALK